MKVVFIYGPPAAGKLTVAKELALFTHFKLLHNHLTVDLATALFDFGTEPYLNYVRRLRLEAVELAARAEIAGLIMTFVYHATISHSFIEELQRVVEAENATLCFIHLSCSPTELKKRIVSEERKQYKKLSSVEVMDKLLDDWQVFSPIPSVESLSIDNSDKFPQQVAEEISSHYHLLHS